LEEGFWLLSLRRVFIKNIQNKGVEFLSKQRIENY
jgi:hypothetical protein